MIKIWNRLTVQYNEPNRKNKMTEVDALGAYTPTEKEVDGIPESELWALAATLTEYILPRLQAFRKMKRHGYPVLAKDTDELDAVDGDS